MLHRGANPNAKQKDICTNKNDGPSVLFYAVKNQYKCVCAILLKHGALPDMRCPELPYAQAYRDSNDDIAAMLIKYMSNEL